MKRKGLSVFDLKRDANQPRRIRLRLARKRRSRFGRDVRWIAAITVSTIKVYNFIDAIEDAMEEAEIIITDPAKVLGST